MNIYKWLNHEKSRYYTIIVEKVKHNDILLKYYWGGCNSNRGGSKNIRINTQQEVELYINKMIKRRKIRGYELISPLIKNIYDYTTV